MLIIVGRNNRPGGTTGREEQQAGRNNRPGGTTGQEEQQAGRNNRPGILSADHRCGSQSECDASVSPSQMDWASSTGLIEPEEIDEEEPTVHSSLSPG